LLIHELNHRVKNTLAMVQALVRHTLRDHDVPREVEQEVTERLIALSAAHDVLCREEWRDAELSEVIGELMLPYDRAGRLQISGPKVWISPRTAIGLAMGLQELATNAAKYGALSAPGGRVELRWKRRGELIELEWRESGGPPVTTPKLSGFGSLLLGRLLAAQLGHPAELTYAPEGLTCRLQAPAVRRRAKPKAQQMLRLSPSSPSGVG
jgi:two-component sensor histidine kinase